MEYEWVNGRYVPKVNRDFMGRPVTDSATPNLDASQANLDMKYDSMFDTSNVNNTTFNAPPKTGWEQTKDFLGSDTFSNTLQGAGLALGAYSAYNQAKETKKQNQRMFDLEKGQVDRANAYQDKFQKNYLSGR